MLYREIQHSVGRKQDDLKEKRGHCKLKRKHQIAPCGELALEEAMDLS
jgi:hypothetical protein